ncbi:hypothetical protein D3C73_1091640 [compost metagenome]
MFNVLGRNLGGKFIDVLVLRAGKAGILQDDADQRFVCVQADLARQEAHQGDLGVALHVCLEGVCCCLVVVERLDGLVFLAQGLAHQEEVFLPREAGANAEDRGSDGGQLLVQLVSTELAAQDQVRL